MQEYILILALCCIAVTLFVYAFTPSKKRKADADDGGYMPPDLDVVRRVSRCLSKSGTAFFLIALILAAVGGLLGGPVVAGFMGGSALSLAVVCWVLGSNLN